MLTNYFDDCFFLLGSEVPVIELANCICASQMGETYRPNTKVLKFSNFLELLCFGFVVEGHYFVRLML